jgi:dCTP deaminase
VTMLGRQEMIDRLRNRTLVVSPLLSESQVGVSSIDLRMGNVVLMARARGFSHVEPMWAAPGRGGRHDGEMIRRQKHERYELTFRMPLLLHPGALALVPTLEWIQLPKDLMGMVTARSTWAREGLSIATATMIEPGYQGIVTLELANLGQIPIALYPGLELAQIAFARMGETTPATAAAPPRPGERLDKPQFHLSFEPHQGKLAKPSEMPFLPAPEKKDDRLAVAAKMSCENKKV